MRENQKIENQFNLALGLSNEQRKKTADLDVGYNPVLREWEMIVKYSGDISYIAEEMGIQVVPLLSGYAIVRVPEEREEEVANLPEVEYVEKPKSLYFALETGRRLSCVDVLQMGEIGGVGALNGEGVMVAIIDSGIDYRHPDFRNDDGSTRILRLWDQTIMGSPPKGFYMGSEFTSEDINEALNLGIEGRNIVPSVDLSGHGTHVASIAAGNGRASNGVNRGVAPSATLVVVKLGNVMEGGFPRTTQLMTAMDYVVRLALELNMPYVINLSFGNNYGDHQGVSLLETYMDDISNMGRGIIVVGTGNEGNKRRHKSGNLLGQEEAIIEIGIEEGEGTLNLQIWKVGLGALLAIEREALAQIGNDELCHLLCVGTHELVAQISQVRELTCDTTFHHASCSCGIVDGCVVHRVQTAVRRLATDTCTLKCYVAFCVNGFLVVLLEEALYGEGRVCTCELIALCLPLGHLLIDFRCGLCGLLGLLSLLLLLHHLHHLHHHQLAL